MKIAHPQILWSSMCWLIGKRKATLVDLSHVNPLRIMNSTIIAELKFRHCPHPRAMATCTPYDVQQEQNKYVVHAGSDNYGISLKPELQFANC